MAPMMDIYGAVIGIMLNDLVSKVDVIKYQHLAT